MFDQGTRAVGEEAFAVLVMSAALGLAFVLTVAVARGRQVPWSRGSLVRVAMLGLVSAWSLALASLTLRPMPLGGRSTSLVPLSDVMDLLTGSVDVSVPATQILGNIALFVPFGLLAPLAFGWAVGRTLLATTSIALGVEVLQFVMATGRVASIDDVLLAALGGGLGALLTHAVAGLAGWRTSARSAPEIRGAKVSQP